MGSELGDIWVWVKDGLLVLWLVVDLEMRRGMGRGLKWNEVQYLGEG